jgi:hypothetical protein
MTETAIGIEQDRGGASNGPKIGEDCHDKARGGQNSGCRQSGVPREDCQRPPDRSGE